MSTPQPQRPAVAGAHSPLPWHQNEKPWFIHAANGERIATVHIPSVEHRSFDIATERSALIVTAVNERPALLARLAAAETLAEAGRLALDEVKFLYGELSKLQPGSYRATHTIHVLTAALAAWEATTATAGAQEGAK